MNRQNPRTHGKSKPLVKFQTHRKLGLLHLEDPVVSQKKPRRMDSRYAEIVKLLLVLKTSVCSFLIERDVEVSSYANGCIRFLEVLSVFASCNLMLCC